MVFKKTEGHLVLKEIIKEKYRIAVVRNSEKTF